MARKQAQMVSGDTNKGYTVTAHMKWVKREKMVFRIPASIRRSYDENFFDWTYSIYSVLSKDGSWRIGKSSWCYKRKRSWMSPYKWWNYFGLTSILKCGISSRSLLNLKAWIYYPSSQIFQTWFTLSRYNLRLPSFYTRSAIL